MIETHSKKARNDNNNKNLLGCHNNNTLLFDWTFIQSSVYKANILSYVFQRRFSNKYCMKKVNATLLLKSHIKTFTSNLFLIEFVWLKM